MPVAMCGSIHHNILDFPHVIVTLDELALHENRPEVSRRYVEMSYTMRTRWSTPKVVTSSNRARKVPSVSGTEGESWLRRYENLFDILGSCQSHRLCRTTEGGSDGEGNHQGEGRE
ncbi:hypothetical protein GUJ93_ZPchr0013g35529 [Zizania palustris]|uniref:Uncharacterized protein n=1 Tax=Zizania palustris TaxID=103762 RepID=A0A8J6BUP7_ZIZPA|nr:hypothetical protein GUJ93_ZPchr0013g35529 [Zizania palustris]